MVQNTIKHSWNAEGGQSVPFGVVLSMLYFMNLFWGRKNNNTYNA